MTLTEFEKTSFGFDSKVEYDGKIYDIISVDFKEALICIEQNGIYIWVRCENCELLNDN